MQISFKLNGKPVSLDVAPHELLSDVVRERLGLTGTHVGCDTSQCGACVVHVDGISVKSCTSAGRDARRRRASPPSKAWPRQWHAASDAAGLSPRITACSAASARPGMIMSAVDFAAAQSDADARGVRRWLEGNICRCTGYQNIVASVMAGAAAMQTQQRSLSMTNPTGIGVSLRRKEDCASSRAAATTSPTSSGPTWRWACSCARRTRTRASRSIDTAAALRHARGRARAHRRGS